MLGAVAALQAGISEELLLITGLVGVVTAVVAATQLRIWPAVRSGLPGLAGAGVAFVVLSSPLLVTQLFLTSRVHVGGGRYYASVGDFVFPLHRQLFGVHLTHHTVLHAAEDGVYLGPVLICLVLVGVVLTVRRDARVRIAAITLVVVLAMTLGPGRAPGVVLPWDLVSGLPFFSSVLPVRLSVAGDLILAWLISHWADNIIATRPGRRSGPALLAIGAGVLSLVPAAVPTITAPPVPAWFTSASGAGRLPAGAPILVLPGATKFDVTAMMYQQAANFRFAQPGGYALNTRQPHGQTSSSPPMTPLVRLNAVAAGRAGAGGPAFSTREIAAGRAALTEGGYRAIVVVDSTPSTRADTALAEALTNRPAEQTTGGVSTWSLRCDRDCR